MDPPAANERFAAKLGLRFPLLCDTEKSVTAAFGVARPGAGAKRSTFLIDPDGTIRKVYPSVKPAGHAAQVLADARDVWGG